MALLVNGKIRHREVQMTGKRPRDMVSDKVELRSHSLSTPMPITLIFA